MSSASEFWSCTLQTSRTSASDRKENGAPSQPDRAVPLEAPVPGAELEAPGPPLEPAPRMRFPGVSSTALWAARRFFEVDVVFKDKLKRTPHVFCFFFFGGKIDTCVNWLSRPSIEQAKRHICLTYCFVVPRMSRMKRTFGGQSGNAYLVVWIGVLWANWKTAVQGYPKKRRWSSPFYPPMCCRRLAVDP